MNKKLISIMLALMLMISCNAYGYELFNASDWAKSEFSEAVGYGLIPESILLNDYTNEITRLEFCNLIVSCYKKLVNEGDVPKIMSYTFMDIYDQNVEIAHALGIVSGMGDGQFMPYEAITREQVSKMMSVMISLIDKSNATGSDITIFSDAFEVSEWAIPYVHHMVSGGYMNGVSGDTFAPKGNLTIEMAVAIAKRAFVKLKPSGLQPSYINVKTSLPERIESGSLRVEWEASGFLADSESFTVGIYGQSMINSSYSLRENALTFASSVKENSAELSVTESMEGMEAFLIVSKNGVFSEPVKFLIGKPNIYIKNKAFHQSFEPLNVVEWHGVSSAADYEIEIIEDRDSYNPNVLPRSPYYFKTGGETYFNLDFQPNRLYTIKIYAIAAEGYKLPYYDELTKYVYPDYEQKNREKIYSLETKEQADAAMQTITVNVWKVDKNGAKYASKATLTVHSEIADVTYRVFEEIFNGAEKFPIKSVGAYAWRAPMSSGRLSEHNYGTAIDINPDENFCVYSNGTTVGKYWKPYEDQYSITPYGDVISAFERNGFTWGGDAWSNPYDYMHFSYFGT